MKNAIMAFGSLALAGLHPTIALAEIKSLSSGEMTDTFVEDSAIIVTPAMQPKPVERRVVTYTISPGEPLKTEAERQAEEGLLRDQNRNTLEEINQNVFQLDEQFALQTQPRVDLAPLVPRPIFQGIEVPEGPFTFQDLTGLQPGAPLPYDGELNYGFDGQSYTLTIGNIPGFNPVNLDQSYQGQLLELRPRDTGGIDLILTPPAAGQ